MTEKEEENDGRSKIEERTRGRKWREEVKEVKRIWVEKENENRKKRKREIHEKKKKKTEKTWRNKTQY